MRSIAGAIILLAASICYAGGALGDAFAKSGERFLGQGTIAAVILGVVGLVIVFAGMLEKQT